MKNKPHMEKAVAKVMRATKKGIVTFWPESMDEVDALRNRNTWVAWIKRDDGVWVDADTAVPVAAYNKALA